MPAERPTDVIFYGRLNNYRSSIIASLRAANVIVRHLNAGIEGVWGDELTRAIDSSRIVLSLRYFGESTEGEW